MKKINFQKQLFFYYSVIMLCFITISSAAFFLYTYNNLKESTKTTLTQLTTKTLNELDNLFTDMDKMALYICSNPTISNTFYQAFNTPYSNYQLNSEIASTLTSINAPNSASRFRLNIYNENRNFISSGIAFNPSQQSEWFASPEFDNWYKKLPILSNHKSIQCFQDDYLSSDKNLMASLYREIYNPLNINKTIGVVEIQCPYETFASILTLTGTNYSCFLYDQNGKQIYPYKQNQNTGSKLYRQFAGDQTHENSALQNFFYYGQSSEYSNFTLIMTQPTSQVITVMKPMLLMLFLFTLLTLGIFLYLVYQVSSRITQPLRNLSESVEQVSLNNLYLKADTEEFKDEFSQLNVAFQGMFQRLQDSMDEVMLLKAHEMQAHMIALQAQMDPHFLYNMLTIIKAMSHQSDVARIGMVCDYLVRMLRYNSTYDRDLIPIEKEFQHTEDYLNLMKVRYEDMFEYSFQISPHIKETNIQIPKLSLQPIVENCFQHGFKQTLPPWIIKICCWTDDNNWYLSVEDNGIGMAEEEINKLEKRVDEFLSNPSSNLSMLKIGGMGLINTIVRLKLKYKDDITFHIEQIPDGGTRITIGGTYYDNDFIS